MLHVIVFVTLLVAGFTCGIVEALSTLIRLLDSADF